VGDVGRSGSRSGSENVVYIDLGVTLGFALLLGFKPESV